MKLNARVSATRILQRLEKPNAFIASELKSEFDRHGTVDPRDRGLTTELVYGVLRQQRRLDYNLRPLVKGRYNRLEPEARILLRLGAYQILFLDRIPKPICVSATQDAARSMGKGRMTGLINAVLRRVDPDSENLPKDGSVKAISIRTSLPEWIVEALSDAYGAEDCEKEALALRDRAPMTIRPNLVKGSRTALRRELEEEGFACEDGPHGSFIVSGPGDPFGTKSFRRGSFVPQDPASLAVIEAMGDVEGQSILDLCSGRGIKATALAARGANVTCVDPIHSKLEQGKTLATNLGVRSKLRFITGDPVEETLGLTLYDQVLVDAPCTGLGTLRRHPESAWRRTKEDIYRLGKLQKQLVEVGLKHLKPNGVLTYAVCTFTRFEGELSVPSSVESTNEDLTTRPSDGWDAFQMRRWRRIS
jgi:16S rRNA (cytosine967-C5)-methyltransferase